MDLNKRLGPIGLKIKKLPFMLVNKKRPNRIKKGLDLFVKKQN